MIFKKNPTRRLQDSKKESKNFLNVFVTLWLCVGFIILFSFVRSFGAEEAVALKYTYRPETAQISVLHDIKGRAYLPLYDAAQFYGIQMTFDSQSRRITLAKGKSQVKIVLSQPVFLTVNPEVSYPIDPAEVVTGQVAITPESAEDIFSAILNISVRYQADQKSLLVGGVQLDEIKEEIIDSERKKTAVPAVPLTSAGDAATPTPAETVQARTAVQPAPRPEADETEALVKTVEEPPSIQNYQVRRVVIDPGHGGRDSGAKGYTRKYFEKQATLDIAKRVDELLKQDGNIEVLMTRSTDKYISLKYRTDFANRHNADLFVSIHCNSNPRSLATGTEIYCYGNRPSNKLAAVAAVSEGTINDTLALLADLGHHFYDTRSRALADEVDSRIGARLKQHIRLPQKGPFYVLRQVDMPSILIETAFISNKTEEIKLRDPYWRDQIAKAIAEGIIAYRDQMNRVAHNDDRKDSDGTQQARR